MNVLCSPARVQGQDIISCCPSTCTVLLFYQGTHRLNYGLPFREVVFLFCRPVRYSVYLHGLGPEVPSNQGKAIPSHLGDIRALGLFENARLVHRRGDIDSFSCMGRLGGRQPSRQEVPRRHGAR